MAAIVRQLPEGPVCRVQIADVVSREALIITRNVEWCASCFPLFGDFGFWGL